MKKENYSSLWDKFQMSGSVTDYLNYKSGKSENIEKTEYNEEDKLTSDKGQYNLPYGAAD